MSLSKPLLLSLTLLLGLVLLPAQPVLAHGEMDEDMLAEFQDHLDDFQQDVDALVADVGPIVDGHAAGEDVTGLTAAIIEQWEEVGVHGAIETRATITYPGIWQALISLQQTATSGRPSADVTAAGERLKAALWQGFGAVRLAASQVTSQPPAVAEGAPASGPETVDQILADLDSAVAAYQAGNLKQAVQLIHDTYMTRFEGLEGELIEHDPDLVSSLEKDFNANLPLLMQQGADLAAVRAQLAAMTEHLETASRILEQAEQTRSEVF
jgi:hypothetical protein